MQKRLVCLHGFLGLPSDWDFLREALPSVEVVAFPVWELTGGLGEAADQLAQRTQRGDWVLGYSMGGRIALNSLVRNPGHFSGGIFVSANPGIEGDKERRLRMEADENWARRFESEDWNAVLAGWNAQPVLASGPALPRAEKDFSRDRLAGALRDWSVARQDNLWPDLSGIRCPSLWIAGERDQKYVGWMEKAAGLSGGDAWVCEGAGHRVPWDRPAEFSGRLAMTRH